MSAVLIFVMTLPLILPALAAAPAPAPGPALMDPTTIPKYVNQLSGPPPIYDHTPFQDAKLNWIDYKVDMSQFQQQILPPVNNPVTGLPYPKTTVWGYGGNARDAVTGAALGYIQNSPAPSFEAVKGSPITVKWINNLNGNHLFAVDPTLDWANSNGMATPVAPFNAYPPGYAQAQSNVPAVPHLHGAEVQSTSDGGPDAWFTATGTRGMDYNTELPLNAGEVNAAVFQYPNSQLPATLWYHDHAMGMTRINVMSGLAGFYLLRDPADAVAPLLPAGKYEVPLAIQDRMFQANGELYFPSAGLNPGIHPYWVPEFFGNTMMVNGLVWPNMNVDQGWYRLRLLDGSNARFYTLSMSNKMPMTMIGSEGGYLKAPVVMDSLTIAPGERADILLDFSNIPAGTKIILQNSAKSPFPRGAPADPKTVGQIMQFTVTANAGFNKGLPLGLPALLNPTLAGAFPTLVANKPARILTLQETMGPAGPVMITLDGQYYRNPVSELPKAGTTEEWVIVNPTADTHPIHLHLVQFQLVSRQSFQVKAFQNAWMAANGMPPFLHQTIPVAPGPFLQNKPMAAPPEEQGWKDTIKMNPGEVTIIVVRFNSDTGNNFPFDPTSGPGYVWHCHIIDHEDNEMMRPYKVVP